MDHSRIYDSSNWQSVREEVLVRDGNCALSWLSACSGSLHVHHTEYDNPFDSKKLVTLCASHHGMLHGALRNLTRPKKWKICKHVHRTRESREQCEQRLNRTLTLV